VVEFALGADGSPMRQNDMLGNGESKSRSPRFARARLIDAVETFKETRQMLRGNAGAKVFDEEFDAARHLARSENKFLS